MPPQLTQAWARVTEFLNHLRALARRYPVRAALVLPGLVLVYLLVLLAFLPSTADLRKARSEVPSTVVAADGAVLAEFKRLNRQWVPLAKVAPSVVQALIATEDHRFYSHHGIDFQRTAAAVFHTLRGDLQGGSTITQQLARNLYPEEIGHSLSIHRKAKEALTALKIEALYAKDEILEIYLNNVEWGEGVFGAEAAAQHYFRKPAARLSAFEAARLSVMLPRPKFFERLPNSAYLSGRAGTIVARMGDAALP